jgi:hypothetical protein
MRKSGNGLATAHDGRRKLTLQSRQEVASCWHHNLIDTLLDQGHMEKTMETGDRHGNKRELWRRAPNYGIFEIGHADIPLSDWEAFRDAPPRDLIEEVVDRSETELPPGFVPKARGVAFPSRALLHRAVIHGFYSHRSQHAGREFVRQDWDGTWLDTSRFGDLWTVEWLTWVTPQVLVHRIGSTPIVARTSEEAIRLAELCTLDPPPGLCWVANMPPKVELLEFAQRVTCAAHREHWRAKAA